MHVKLCLALGQQKVL